MLGHYCTTCWAFYNFLTSASLVKVFNDKRNNRDNLKIEVRHEDNIATGFLGEYDLDQNIAVVNVMNFPDLHDVHLYDSVRTPPHSKVVAVGRDITGKLIATSGMLNPYSVDREYRGELMSSTCIISKDYEGGPLFDLDGNFVGMNVSLSAGRTLFLTKFKVVMWLVHNSASLQQIELPSSKAIRVGERLKAYRDVPRKDRFGDLEFLSYPKPPEFMLNDDIILVNSFEETFGDEFGGGVWSELSETTSSTIRENIVALASFSGEKRFSACTGFFIQWNGCTTILTSASLITNSGCENKIVENLRIEVLRPNKQRAEGTLQHYNLHYNVALVSVKDFSSDKPAIIEHPWDNGSDLLAVGLCFKSGTLMVAEGKAHAVPPLKLDCKYLQYSTCRITKAGIGGPLLNFDGKFVGMNFYTDEVGGTSYLSWWEILAVLKSFNTKGTVAESDQAGNQSRAFGWTMAGDSSIRPNSWWLPQPYWCRVDELDRLDLKKPGICFIFT